MPQCQDELQAVYEYITEHECKPNQAWMDANIAQNCQGKVTRWMDAEYPEMETCEE